MNIRLPLSWFLPALLLSAHLLHTGCFTSPRPKLEEIERYDTRGWAHDVTLAQSKIYISDRQGGFLVFHDIEKPRLPEPRIPATDVISLAPLMDGALLAARFEGIVRVSSTGEVLGSYSNGDIANAVAVQGDLAYVAYGLRGLVIARMGEREIRAIAELKTPGWSHHVKLYRNYALLADWNYGLRIVDVRDPAHPVEVAVVPTATTAIAVHVIEGNPPIAALAEGHSGVALVDISDPMHPNLLARHSLGLNASDPPHPESGGWAHGIASSPGYLFVANWKRGLAVLDIHDVRRPRIALEMPLAGTALAVATYGRLNGSTMVFLADGEAGLRYFYFTS